MHAIESRPGHARTLRRSAGGLGVVAMLAFLATPMSAQSLDPGLAVSVNYGFLGGDDFDLIDPAIGFEALGSLAWPSGFELGVGVGISSHDVDPGDADADFTSLFGEGRYRFNVPADEVRHLHPFLAGRLGYVSLDFDGDVDTSGLLFGAGGGAEYWLSEVVALDGGLHLNFLNLDDDVSGTKVDLRLGAKVRF